MKTKKSKKRHKNQEELSPKKVNLKENDDNSDDLTSSSNNNIEQNYQAKRKHTKIAKKKKDKDIKESIKVEEGKIKGKKVKFGKIQIINVECWKEINLNLTAEENVDELMKITKGKDDKRIKNIGCTCMII